MSRPYDADEPRPPPPPPGASPAAGPGPPPGNTPTSRKPGLYILSLSVHGLVRGQDMELGRDADTGGQVSYVVDQARALARLPDVDQVDLVTRRVQDRAVDQRYAATTERLADRARIVRLPFGPRRYLHKESLWPHLPSLVDQIMRHLRAQHRAPDIVHGHYADAGMVGAQVAKILGVPFLFTGHSLGRVKAARLREHGHDDAVLEERYHFARRIEAEEGAVETAAAVIASTRQEVEEQYALYHHYRPERMVVIPPGVDLSRFTPPHLDETAPWRSAAETPRIAGEVYRFLTQPEKPLILAMARPDERKNFATLVEAYGRNRALRERANLLLVAGTRDDIREMPAGARKVLTEILLLIDRYDLYGSVAYPKAHGPDDVADLYRMAAASGGVFVNPALTEPFGLTLLEAAASGVPVLAPNDGGPRDILGACRNGLLLDPRDAEEMGSRILAALEDRARWEEWSRNGLKGVRASFSWESHARRYVEVARSAMGESGAVRPAAVRSRLPGIDRILVANLDHTLSGDLEALGELLRTLREAGDHVGFALTTGKPVPMATESLAQLGIPPPDILVCATGTEIYYGASLTPDRSWERQIDHFWEPERVKAVLAATPGLALLDDEPATRFRLRFRALEPHALRLQRIRRTLRKQGLRVTATLDHGRDLDVTPVSASPGLAIRFLAYKWDLPPDRMLVTGDSGNDADALEGDMLGVVVGNHSTELEALRDRPRVFFSRRPHAWGILDGIRHYDFFGSVRIPEHHEPLLETTTA